MVMENPSSLPNFEDGVKVKSQQNQLHNLKTHWKWKYGNLCSEIIENIKMQQQSSK